MFHFESRQGLPQPFGPGLKVDCCCLTVSLLVRARPESVGQSGGFVEGDSERYGGVRLCSVEVACSREQQQYYKTPMLELLQSGSTKDIAL